MIDYASIKPMMSLSTFIVGFFIILFIGALFAEALERYNKNKSPQDVGRRPAGLRRLSPSQKAIQRYYNRKGA